MRLRTERRLALALAAAAGIGLLALLAVPALALVLALRLLLVAGKLPASVLWAGRGGRRAPARGRAGTPRPTRP